MMLPAVARADKGDRQGILNPLHALINNAGVRRELDMTQVGTQNVCQAAALRGKDQHDKRGAEWTK